MSLASTAAVDRLVLQYLKRRRLHEAGKVLSLELRASCAPEDVEMQAWSEVNDGDDDGALLEALALDGSEPAAYARAYTAFAAWVDASLDLYKGSVEDAWAQAKFDRLEREAAAEADAGAGSADGATKKQRAALAKAAADAKAQRESVAANRMACEIPLPPRTEEESAALASELDGRVAVSPSALPSALLCTFATPVLALEFSHRNLLLGAGALALYRPRKLLQRYDFLAAVSGALVVTCFCVAKGQDPGTAVCITATATVVALVLNELVESTEA
ncbi:hypothetical protein APUTEX25_005849 [Auxenochlorella protothecoides]|uniref:Uncharacterized protein n=1 Tax=Auxenochlorella protothecoides TaxID=3075 RepID=A0A3M7KZ56_AUXPR|nr:hypothetical protein APUTEX25_005849 [Auxenochlorella protothecoides]|eukprot:RMZ55808.1 hypothetical protein APUTEX25_005849 [Auxenochlorella protothecoides]